MPTWVRVHLVHCPLWYTTTLVHAHIGTCPLPTLVHKFCTFTIVGDQCTKVGGGCTKVGSDCTKVGSGRYLPLQKAHSSVSVQKSNPGLSPFLCTLFKWLAQCCPANTFLHSLQCFFFLPLVVTRLTADTSDLSTMNYCWLVLCTL